MMLGKDYERRFLGISTMNVIQNFDPDTVKLYSKYKDITNEIDYVASNSFSNSQISREVINGDHYGGIGYTCVWQDGWRDGNYGCYFHVRKIGKYRRLKVEAYIYYKLIKAAYEKDPSILIKFEIILMLDAIIYGAQKKKFEEKCYAPLVEMRKRYGEIPVWTEEMETNPKLVIDLYKASVPK